MSKFYRFTLFVVLVALAVGLAGCGAKAADTGPKTVKVLTMQQAGPTTAITRSLLTALVATSVAFCGLQALSPSTASSLPPLRMPPCSLTCATASFEPPPSAARAPRSGPRWPPSGRA